MSEIKDFLEQFDMFSGLSDEMLAKVVDMCQLKTYEADSTIIERNTPPDDFYLIQDGTVRVITAPEDQTQRFLNAAVITLGKGQSFGEMGLIDNGPRSATVKANTDAKLLVIDCQRFSGLCETDTELGYRVMKNIAMDLSFKLRYGNLI